MNLSIRRISIVTALFAIVAVTLASVGVSFASPYSASRLTSSGPAQLVAVLTTQGNKSISVNGASIKTGGSVPSGALIETPDGTGGTLRIPGLGTVCIAPNSKLNIQFDQTGGIRVTLVQGCAILRTLKGTAGLINTAQGTVGQIDAATGGSIDVCTSPIGAAMTNQGAAAAAGAGASALDCGAPAGAAAVPAGLSTPAKVGIFGGITAAVLTPLLFRGSNPSPFTL